jgi:hypothetical protein
MRDSGCAVQHRLHVTTLQDSSDLDRQKQSDTQRFSQHMKTNCENETGRDKYWNAMTMINNRNRRKSQVNNIQGY